MKLLKLAATSILGLATLAATSTLGDSPATRPTSRPSETGRTSSVGSAGQVRRALRALVTGRTASVRPYTPQEWDEMMTFLNEYSPAREHVLASTALPENSPIRLDAIRRWRTYNFTREHFPLLADLMLNRFTLEDDLFVLTLHAQASGEDSEEMRDLIHRKVAQLVSVDFHERQTRIDRLKAMLDEETQNLTHDQAIEGQLIDQRTNVIMNRIGMSGASPTSPSTRPDGQARFPNGFAPTTPPPPTAPISNPPQ